MRNIVFQKFQTLLYFGHRKFWTFLISEKKTSNIFGNLCILSYFFHFFQSAPSLDHINEDDEAPPQLPEKMSRSTSRNSSTVHESGKQLEHKQHFFTDDLLNASPNTNLQTPLLPSPPEVFYESIMEGFSDDIISSTQLDRNCNIPTDSDLETIRQYDGIVASESKPAPIPKPRPVRPTPVSTSSNFSPDGPALGPKPRLPSRSKSTSEMDEIENTIVEEGGDPPPLPQKPPPLPQKKGKGVVHYF